MYPKTIHNNNTLFKKGIENLINIDSYKWRKNILCLRNKNIIFHFVIVLLSDVIKKVEKINPNQMQNMHSNIIQTK